MTPEEIVAAYADHSVPLKALPIDKNKARQLATAAGLPLRRPRWATPELKAEARRAIDAGESYYSIARRLGCSRQHLAEMHREGKL